MNDEPTGPYIYQPYGMQDKDQWESKRVYAISGVPFLIIKGLTKDEAEKVLAILKERKP